MSIQALVNSILIRSFEEKEPITPMKLQKLVYFVYREYLRESGKPPFTELFETWKYGPVLPSVYDEFNSFGSSPITKFARDAKGTVFTIDDKKSPIMAKCINKVWEKYKRCSGIELSKLTHLDGSAWSNAFEKGAKTLDIEDICNEQIN